MSGVDVRERTGQGLGDLPRQLLDDLRDDVLSAFMFQRLDQRLVDFGVGLSGVRSADPVDCSFELGKVGGHGRHSLLVLAGVGCHRHS